jgi:hypothetical protein
MRRLWTTSPAALSPSSHLQPLTGRSKPVRHGAGAFASETFVAVDADSDRAHDVLGTTARRDRDTEASRAVHAWLADRSAENRHAAINALQAIDEG